MKYKKYKYGGHKVPGMYMDGGAFGNSMGGGKPIRKKRMQAGGPPSASGKIEDLKNVIAQQQGQQQQQQPMDQKTMQMEAQRLMADSMKLKNKAMEMKLKEETLKRAKTDTLMNASPNDTMQALDTLQTQNEKLKRALGLMTVKMQKQNLIDSLRNKTMIQNQISDGTRPSPKKYGGSHKKRKK
tara:strand:- start:133 stop:684 length:552 start_codon:yes stop_codon:yes gene_type:complete